jgi:hypothetical protein
MAFKPAPASPFIKANICSLNPESLQGFEMVNYTSKFTEIPNKALPDLFQKGYELIFKRLGLPYSSDESTLVVGSDSGAFKNLYYPNTYSDEGICVVKWGKGYIPLKDFLTAFPNPNVNIDMEAKKARLEFIVSLTDEEKEDVDENGNPVYPYKKLIFPVKLFFDPDKEWVEAVIVQEIINNKDGFVDADLAEFLKGKGATTLITPMKEIQTIPCVFQVVGFSSRQAPYGISNTMNCIVPQNSEPIIILDRDGFEISLAPGQKVDVWATGNSNNTLNTIGAGSQFITPEFPATLTIKDKRILSTGKTSVINVLELHANAKNGLQKQNDSMIKLNW